MAQKHKTPFAQPETHTDSLNQRGARLLSHTDCGFQINAREESMDGGGSGEANSAHGKDIFRKVESRREGDGRKGKGKRGDSAELIDLRAKEEGDVSPQCSLMPDAAHLQQLPARLISMSHIANTSHT